MERDPTDVIMADPELSDGARINLYWLWHLAGRRPNRILTNKHELAALAHRDIRTIDGNLKRLHTAGRIDLEWDKQRGAIEVYVYHPASNKPEARPDPQRVLGFHSADEAMPEPPAGSGTPPVRSESFAQGLSADLAQTIPDEKPLERFAQIIPDEKPQVVSPQGDPDSRLERFVQTVPASQCTCDNITRTRASDDSDDEEEISSSSSLSLSAQDLVHGAIDLIRRLFPGLKPNLCHRDKVLLASAVAIAWACGKKGKTWLDESVAATTEHKPQKPVRYLKTCLREGVAIHLRRCNLAETADEFGRLLFQVRSFVEKAIVEYRQSLAKRKEQTTVVGVGKEKGREDGTGNLGRAEKPAPPADSAAAKPLQPGDGHAMQEEALGRGQG